MVTIYELKYILNLPKAIPFSELLAQDKVAASPQQINLNHHIQAQNVNLKQYYYAEI